MDYLARSYAAGTYVPYVELVRASAAATGLRPAACMSTRKLIAAALLCGLVILAAFTVQMLTLL